MQNLLVKGRVKNKLLVWTYALDVLKVLKLHRLRTRPIIIKFKNDIGGSLGLCEGDKQYAYLYIAKKCPITGRKFTFLELMRTMTHELVHARQFLRGELRAEGGWTWKGKPANNIEYDKQPWEREAYRLEEEIFNSTFPIHMPFDN